MITKVNTTYFLSRPVEQIKDKLQTIGQHFEYQNDFDKQICISPQFKIIVENNVLGEIEENVFELTTQEIATFYVVAESYEDARSQVIDLVDAKMPKDTKDWEYNYRILSIETVGPVW